MTGTMNDELDLEAIATAAAAVPDPELPVVTLGDLGIVRAVTLADDGAVEVAITPTYVGCPATEAIAADVRERVAAELDGTREVRAHTVLTPAWTTDWITDDGRRKLREHGIAPPTGRRRAAGPVAVEISLRPPGEPSSCPRCGSADTRLLSGFGSTPCQSLRACRACGEPFGAIKTL